MSDDLEGAVARHYGAADLTDRILKAMAAAGIDTERVAPEQLAPIDEFHIGGRAATIHAVAKMDLTADQPCARCRLRHRRSDALPRLGHRLPRHRHRSDARIRRRRRGAGPAHRSRRPHRVPGRQRAGHAVRERSVRRRAHPARGHEHQGPRRSLPGGGAGLEAGRGVLRLRRDEGSQGRAEIPGAVGGVAGDQPPDDAAGDAGAARRRGIRGPGGGGSHRNSPSTSSAGASPMPRRARRRWGCTS